LYADNYTLSNELKDIKARSSCDGLGSTTKYH